MKVKGGGGGGGRSWEEMPVDVAVFQDTSNHFNASFALFEQQAYEAPQPQSQPQEQELEHQGLEEADDGDGEGDVVADGEAGGDGVADGEADGVVDDDENRERNKLADGFYEIEAIRRKRVRKGQLQYLIKWRGWPETANTWEPLDNLQSIADVIEAFEVSLRTGKHRKRKRKNGTPHSQPKKRQQRPTVPSYNMTDVEIRIVDTALSSSPLNSSSLVDLPLPQQSMGLAHEEENDGHLNNIETAKNTDAEVWCSNVSQQVGERRKGIEYDPKLSELRATISTNTVNADKLSVHFQEQKPLEVNGLTDGLSKVDSAEPVQHNHSTGVNGPTDGLSKVGCAEPVQNNRSTGARRRKSGSVKRFKQETHLSEQGATTNATSRFSVRYGSRGNQSGVDNLDYAGGNSSRRNRIDESSSAACITKIIKPIGYSTSVANDVQDVLVTFKAMRSDGTEVVVDNKSLKVNHPLLLIDFYEQHLRYNSTL